MRAGRSTGGSRWRMCTSSARPAGEGGSARPWTAWGRLTGGLGVVPYAA
ncbi:hypothetical protein STTU_1739 [Streptomyces sp. Tu6071]|nr:hypothetical protein STTU_1739 [Streptomyces sp. Tu6071]